MATRRTIRPCSTRRAARVAVALVVAACALWLSAASALAARGHVRSSLPAFGGPCSIEPCEGRLKEPWGAAVNEATGDVYVLDKGAKRVVRYSSSGAYLGEFNGSGLLLGEGKAAGSGGLPNEEPTGAFELPISIAVDNSCEQHQPAPLPEPQCQEADPSNGDVYVVDRFGRFDHSTGEPNVIDKFTATGEYVGQITAKSVTNPKMIELIRFNSVAVDPHGKVFATGIDYEFGPIGGTFEVETEIEGVFVFSDAAVNSWEAWRRTVNSVGGSFERGLAVDSADDVYARNSLAGYPGGLVSEWGYGTGLYLEGIDGPVGGEERGALSVAFGGVATESSTGDVYVDNATSVGRFGPAVKGSNPELERFGAGDLPGVRCDEVVFEKEQGCFGGVAVDSVTGQVYVVSSGEQVLQFALEEPSAPTVVDSSVAGVTDDSARAQAEIDPHSLSGEPGTSYRFEYGRCGSPTTCSASAYEQDAPVPAATLSAGFDTEGVSVLVGSLTPSTTYHYRVVAENAHGRAQGEEVRFTTRATGEFLLADGRQWEMVSPSNLHGALVEPLGEGPLSFAPTLAAAGGGVISYATNSPIEAQPTGFTLANQVLSVRGANGWSSQGISVPHSVATDIHESEVQSFSEDLSHALVQPLGSVLLSEAASEQTAYLRDNSSGAYAPLVTGCPAAPTACSATVEEHADVAAGTAFGKCVSTNVCGPQLVDATTDLEHVVLESEASLKPGANQGSNALYEWNAGAPVSRQLQLVSLLPAEKSGEPERPAQEPTLGSSNRPGEYRGAISADGAHVFFSAEGHLYMRDTVADRTIQIDAPQQQCLEEGKCGGGLVSVLFQLASADGNRVFFTDTQKLTADAGEYTEPGIQPTTGTPGADLYVCEVHEDACALTDLAPSGHALAQMLGASEDGSWVYFAANAALAANALSGRCPYGEPSGFSLAASCDLYVQHYEGGAWGKPRVVAAVSGGDGLDWASQVEHMVARVSPDGRWLEFMSQRPLTGFDNRDAESGQHDQEVYLYDAQSGRLACASCNPTGARPAGVEAPGDLALAGFTSRTSWPSSTWLAGSVPGWVAELGVGGHGNKAALYQSRYLSDSGRLFFNAHDALVSQDVNGVGDVYEYEPAGVPAGPYACSPGSSSGAGVYKPARPFALETAGVSLSGEEGAGCVSLISSGGSSEESAFLEAGETGGDVFFLSTAPLSPLDSEGSRTVYDAHECTAASPCIQPPSPPPPACVTEASCRPAPSPQPSIFGAAGSATFFGSGNPTPAPVPSHAKSVARPRNALASALRACHRIGKRARRRRCERSARSRHAAKSRAINNRRASR